MNIIPHDAYTLLGIPILVWLGAIGVALYIYYAWKLRGPGDED